MNKEFIKKFLVRITYLLEIAVAIFVAIGIVIGLIDYINYFGILYNASFVESYDLFQSFLGYGLLLIVGVELISMIYTHSAVAILDLILFVIARKMLIYSHTMLDLVLGTIAILIVFITIHFFAQEGDKGTLHRKSDNVHAGTKQLSELDQLDMFNFPDNYKEMTIANYVELMAQRDDRPIKEG